MREKCIKGGEGDSLTKLKLQRGITGKEGTGRRSVRRRRKKRLAEKRARERPKKKKKSVAPDYETTDHAKEKKTPS